MPGLLASRTLSPDPSKCFVMMPFAESFNAIYRLIQRVCTEQGLSCQRADEDVKPGKITSKIYDAVADAGIIIADMSGKNPNVFYEMGLAHAVSDNVILLTQSSDDVPFDLKDYLHINYSNTFDGAEKLASDLSKVLTTILRSADTQMAKKRLQLASAGEAPKPPQELVIGASTDAVAEETDLGMLHLRAEIARNGGDLKLAKAYMVRALEIAKSVDGEANEIGNCGIEAERCKFYDLAEELYQIAIEHDPGHVNNRQCYVSFLLDYRARKPGALQKANDLLNELENVPERQERTRALRAQYLTISPKGGDDLSALDLLIKEMLNDKAPLTLEQAAPVLLVMQRARQYDRFSELVEKLKGSAPPNTHWQYDRAIADCFATSENDDLRAKAVEIYDRLVTEGNDTSPALKHNLATLLNKLDKYDKSGRVSELWSSAYATAPGEMNIRRSFAQFLARHNRPHDATKVLEGKPLD